MPMESASGRELRNRGRCCDWRNYSTSVDGSTKATNPATFRKQISRSPLGTTDRSCDRSSSRKHSTFGPPAESSAVQLEVRKSNAVQPATRMNDCGPRYEDQWRRASLR
jgi:hypothetical protein